MVDAMEPNATIKVVEELVAVKKKLRSTKLTGQ